MTMSTGVAVVVLVLGVFVLLVVLLAYLGRSLVGLPQGRIGIVEPFGPAPRLLPRGLSRVDPFVRPVILDMACPALPPHGRLGRVVLEFPDAPGYVVAAFGSDLVVAYVGRTGTLGAWFRATGRVSTIEAVSVIPDPGPPRPGAR